MTPEPGLNARLLVGRQDIVAGPQRNAFPLAGVEIQDALGLGGERRIARKDPGAMPPRAQGVLLEPAPQRGRADLGDQAIGDDRALQVAQRPARQRQPTLRWQLTG
jgi:hypothetical protein